MAGRDSRRKAAAGGLEFEELRARRLPLGGLTTEMFSFSQTGKPGHRDQTGWLGCQESNLGMAESKSAALPLGYTPTTNRPCGRLQPLMTLFRCRFNWERGHCSRVHSRLFRGFR